MMIIAKLNGDTKNKREILEEILEIISKDCDKIEIVKSKDSSSIIEEKKIVTYLNARKMLYEIYQIDAKKFEVLDEYDIIKPALEETLNQGHSISSNEIIRDFDGWSWNIVTEEIENHIANLVYQLLIILVGNDFLEEWKQNKEQDHITKLTDELEKRYKTELAGKLFKAINQVAILNIINYNHKERERLIKLQENLQNEFEELENKKEYITKLGEQKKQIIEKIKNIDDTINNDRKLKNEFISRNELLDMNHRIFSLSDLVEVLEREKTELIKDLNKCSKKMEPLNFIKTKTEIENKLILIKELDLQNENKKIYNIKLKELLNLTLKAIRIQIEKVEEKDDIIKLIYQIRYFSLIYVWPSKQVKDIIDIAIIQRPIITKACKQKAITIFSKNIKENYEIIKNILQTNIIDFETMYFKFIKKEDKFILEIYDEENIYKTIDLPEIKELNVKLNKKIKIFI